MLRIKSTPVLAALAALCIAGCMAEVPASEGAIGVLELPLTSLGSNGSQFALAGTFDLVGPETISTIVAPTDMGFASDDMITMNPRVGAYSLTLSQWSLYLVNIDPMTGVVMGTTPTTGAVLISAATQNVTIGNMQTSTVVYQFSVPGTGVIKFARGTLNIDFTVGEGFADGAACTQAIECASHVCTGGVCAAPTCTDGVQNGGETTPDCGGGCACAGTGGAAGDTCVDATGCSAGLICVLIPGAMAGTCQASGGTGGSCTAASCMGMCIDTNGDGVVDTCQAAGGGALGDTCVDATGCNAPLMCVISAGAMTGTCQTSGGAGGTCTAATCAGMCIDTNGDTILDTCQAAGGGAGSAGSTCDGSAGSCAAGLMCNVDPATGSGICQ